MSEQEFYKLSVALDAAQTRVKELEARIVELTPTSIAPEPSFYMLIGLGLIGMIWVSRRERSARD